MQCHGYASPIDSGVRLDVSPLLALPVIPYTGFQKLHMKGYYFFLPESFGAKPVGETFTDLKHNVEISVHMHSPVSVLDAELLNKGSFWNLEL